MAKEIKYGTEARAALGKVQSGETPVSDDTPNLVEVMACNGGCVGGPCVVKNPKAAAVQLQRYASTGKELNKE